MQAQQDQLLQDASKSQASGAEQQLIRTREFVYKLSWASTADPPSKTRLTFMIFSLAERLQQQIATLTDELDKAEEESDKRLEEMQVRNRKSHVNLLNIR